VAADKVPPGSSKESHMRHVAQVVEHDPRANHYTFGLQRAKVRQAWPSCWRYTFTPEEVKV